MFFNIQKMSEKYENFHENNLNLLHIKKIQTTDNTKVCLEKRQMSCYQPLAFELKVFRLGNPFAFPQHILKDIVTNNSNYVWIINSATTVIHPRSTGAKHCTWCSDTLHHHN